MKYIVECRWAEDLWKAKKLSHGAWEKYLFLRRDGVLAKKRNLDACRERELVEAEAVEMAAVVKRIRTNATLYRPFPQNPQAMRWLECFAEDRLRYPFLASGSR